LAVTDLKFDSHCTTLPVHNSELQGGGNDVFRQTHFLAGVGSSAIAYFPSLCHSVQREPSCQKVLLFRSVPMHGLRPTHLPRKPTRYRSLPSCPEKQTVSHGHSGQSITQHLGRSQREKRLAYLCRFFSISYSNRTQTLYQRRFRRGSRQYSICTRRLNHRPLPFRFSMARFRTTKAAVKLHTLLDLRGNIPSFIHISDGKLHEVNVLDLLIPEPGSFYIMDRGYLDYERLHRLTQASAFFVIRAKANLKYRRLYSATVDKSTSLKHDQTGVLTGFYTSQHYPDKLRKIKYYDPQTGKHLVFLTNNFSLPALTIAELYRFRWQVELFFKWIKQHLRIKAFYGTSENAVKSQIWIAVSIYVLVAIIKKRLKIDASLYTILQILSVTIFEKMPLSQVLTEMSYKTDTIDNCKQLKLF